MVNIKLDASPGKKQKGIPTDPEGRKAYYERLMAIYQAQNPVKFEAKKAELQKKADGLEYIAGKWVNIFSRPLEEQKLTPIEREQLGIEEKLNLDLENKKRLAALEAENIELKAKLGALKEDEVEDEAKTEDEEPKAKPKGRPKKVK